jgi:hypothetical protein
MDSDPPFGAARLRTTTKVAVLAIWLSACGGSESPTGVIPGANPPTTNTPAAFPGFDRSIYPGDATMAAWRYPTSPYYWAGYYLPAPCHRDVTWMSKYSTLTANGWGLAAIYVGQQDWAQIPQSVAVSGARATARAAESTSRDKAVAQQFAVCSASLLSADQATAEAADAVAKLKADGFPDGSTVFLDVEYVSAVSLSLLEYYRAWIAGILKDGHYKPGIYAAKSNAASLRAAALDAYKAAGSAADPPFWIASSSGFSIMQAPTSVGLDYAKLWQGGYDLTQTFGGFTLSVDANVAARKSPSAP